MVMLGDGADILAAVVVLVVLGVHDSFVGDDLGRSCGLGV
jgi:hypothetical protein